MDREDASERAHTRNLHRYALRRRSSTPPPGATTSGSRGASGGATVPLTRRTGRVYSLARPPGAPAVSGTQMDFKTASAHGQTFRFCDSGEGPPVVLIH